MVDYKVCILAAGVGSRMGALTEHISKGILPIANKAVISHIIEKFPENVEIVVAVGHKKETIIDYLSLAHPERKITFVNIDNYLGPGTGPGYSILQCKKYLNCPFVLSAVDTILLEKIPEPNENWLGIAPVKETEPYCTVKIKNNLIYGIDDKIKCDNKYAFIGVAGIKDYETFFEGLERDKELKGGEIQVSNGLTKLIEKKLVPIGVTWFDTGSLNTYKETNENFSSKKFDLSKGNEFLYFVNGRVIKFFSDSNIIKNRMERVKYLSPYCPEIESSKENFYSYKKVEGQVLYDLLNRQIIKDFFQWLKFNLWKEKKIEGESLINFKSACKSFYYNKTLERVEKFYRQTSIEDDKNIINGMQIPQLSEMLEKVDWEYLSNGVPVNFHGDLQFDNVLVTRGSTSHLPKFILLDWRQDFGGIIEYGDLYYDLSKLYGGMILQYPLIRDNKFAFDMSGNSIYYNFDVKNDILEIKEEFETFLKKNNFDFTKIKIITALIFLNMAALLKDPFNLMLYFLGKSRLYYALKEAGVYN